MFKERVFSFGTATKDVNKNSLLAINADSMKNQVQSSRVTSSQQNYYNNCHRMMTRILNAFKSASIDDQNPFSLFYKLEVVGYCRESPDFIGSKTVSQSCQKQSDFIGLIKAEIPMVMEKGKSGRIGDIDFQTIFKSVNLKSTNAIAFTSLDRLARSQVRLEKWFDFARQHGIKLFGMLWQPSTLKRMNVSIVKGLNQMNISIVEGLDQMTDVNSYPICCPIDIVPFLKHDIDFFQPEMEVYHAFCTQLGLRGRETNTLPLAFALKYDDLKTFKINSTVSLDGAYRETIMDLGKRALPPGSSNNFSVEFSHQTSCDCVDSPDMHPEDCGCLCVYCSTFDYPCTTCSADECKCDPFCNCKCQVCHKVQKVDIDCATAGCNFKRSGRGHQHCDQCYSKIWRSKHCAAGPNVCDGYRATGMHYCSLDCYRKNCPEEKKRYCKNYPDCTEVAPVGKGLWCRRCSGH